jgi:hypothetical protein
MNSTSILMKSIFFPSGMIFSEKRRSNCAWFCSQRNCLVFPALLLFPFRAYIKVQKVLSLQRRRLSQANRETISQSSRFFCNYGDGECRQDVLAFLPFSAYIKVQKVLSLQRRNRLRPIGKRFLNHHGLVYTVLWGTDCHRRRFTEMVQQNGAFNQIW